MRGEDDKNNAIGRYAAESDIISNMILSRQVQFFTNKFYNHHKEEFVYKYHRMKMF